MGKAKQLQVKQGKSQNQKNPINQQSSQVASVSKNKKNKKNGMKQKQNKALAKKGKIVKQVEEEEEKDDSDDDSTTLDISEAVIKNAQQNKGIKMFGGLSKKKSDVCMEDDDEDDSSDAEEEQDSSMNSSGLEVKNGNSSIEDEDEDDSDASDEEDEENEKNASLRPLDLLGDSLADDDDDEDEDFEADSDEEEDELLLPAKKSTRNKKNEKKDTSLNAADLLGDTLIDDEDDEDFEAADDDDDEDVDSISDDADEDQVATPKKEKRSKESKKTENDDVLDEEKLNRTIFVGNVKTDTEKKKLEKAFKKYGPIESLRIRGAVAKNPRMPLRGAVITKKYHPKISTVLVYIVFEEEESAKKALAMNGNEFDGNILRVSLAADRGKRDYKKAVFLGNLPFEITDNLVWEHFKKCGEIESVRITRDGRTGLGRGFGYVNFKSEDAVTIALELDGTNLAGRQVRVKQNNPSASPKKRKQRSNSQKPKKQKLDSEKTSPEQSSKNKPKKQQFKQMGKKDGGNKFKKQQVKQNKKKGGDTKAVIS